MATKLDDKQIAQHRSDAVYLQNELNRLDKVGWDRNTPLELIEWTRQISALEAARGEIKDTNPTGAAGSKKLQTLIDQENYATEAIGRLQAEAAKAVQAEQKRFLVGVQPTLYDPLEEQIAATDKAIQDALTKLADALKARWLCMKRKQDISAQVESLTWKLFNLQSPKYMPQLPKPFEGGSLRGFDEMVKHVMNRVSTVFRNGSEQGSENLASGVYDRNF